MRRQLFPAAAALAAAGAPVAGQVPEVPTAEPTAGDPPLDIEPLLPSEGLFERETWSELARGLLREAVDYVPSLIAAILVLVFFLVVARVAERFLDGVFRRSRVDPALRQIGLPLFRYTILAIGLIMALSQAGFQVGSLLAGLGVAGLAVGLAAQDSLGNIVAGFTILWDRPFRIGDKVTIGDSYGEVQHIGLRSTRIRTLDHLDVIFPNKEVINQTIINHTLSPGLRLGVPLGIAYGESIAAAREALLAAIADHPLLADEPPPEVVVTALGDSGVDIELRVWLRDPQRERRALWTMLEIAKLALDQAGIEIPFPQRALHVHPTSPPLPLRQVATEDGGESGPPRPPEGPV